MPQLIVLVGLPGSGKSTLARELVHLDPDWRIIATDAIRAQLYGDEAIQGSWLAVWRQVEVQLQQAVIDVNRGNIAGAVYDATNAARRQRRKVITLARELGFTNLIGVVLNLSFTLCWQRNQERERTVPLEVILKMHRQLQDAPPALDEGWNLILYYCGQSSTEIAMSLVGENRT